MAGNVVKRLVLEDPGPGHVLGLRLAFAPGGKFHEHGERLRRLDPHLEPPPGVLGMELVSRRIGQHRHLFAEPTRALRPVKLSPELGIKVAQMDDVAQRVGQLPL